MQTTYDRVQPVSPRVVEYSLSMEKRPALNKKFTPKKHDTNKNVLVLAYMISLTLDLKIVWFGCWGAVCINKQYENAILGITGCFS